MLVVGGVNLGLRFSLFSSVLPHCISIQSEGEGVHVPLNGRENKIHGNAYKVTHLKRM